MSDNNQSKYFGRERIRQEVTPLPYMQFVVFSNSNMIEYQFTEYNNKKGRQVKPKLLFFKSGRKYCVINHKCLWDVMIITLTSVQLNSVKMIERWIASTYSMHIKSMRFIFDQVRIPSNTFNMNATWQHDIPFWGISSLIGTSLPLVSRYIKIRVLWFVIKGYVLSEIRWFSRGYSIIWDEKKRKTEVDIGTFKASPTLQQTAVCIWRILIDRHCWSRNNFTRHSNCEMIPKDFVILPWATIIIYSIRSEQLRVLL